MILNFDSISSMVDSAEAYPNDNAGALCLREKIWPYNLKNTINSAINGSVGHAEKALSALTKLENELPKTVAWESVRSPFGASVRLGEYLSGSPTPCRRRIKRNHDVNPIKIMVGVNCSASVKDDTIEKRGLAIMGLLLAIQASRPVDLFLLSEFLGDKDGFGYVVCKVESRPLALGQAAFAICDASFARMIMYAHNQTMTAESSLPWAKGYGKQGYDAQRRERLGLNAEDIFVEPAYGTDALLSNPAQWIQKQLDKIKA